MALRILIADDHEATRDGLRLLLETHDHIAIVAEAANGEEAIQMARKHLPDLVIMDISMPVLNGIEATKVVKKQLPQIGIIAFSINLSYEHIARVIQAGAAGFLLKESLGNELIKAIYAVSEGKVFFSSKIDTSRLAAIS